MSNRIVKWSELLYKTRSTNFLAGPTRQGLEQLDGPVDPLEIIVENNLRIQWWLVGLGFRWLATWCKTLGQVTYIRLDQDRVGADPHLPFVFFIIFIYVSDNLWTYIHPVDGYVWSAWPKWAPKFLRPPSICSLVISSCGPMLYNMVT
jgi:hypothetical protein